MADNTAQQAFAYLQMLIGQPLQYGIKSPDWELYDLGFGELITIKDEKGNDHEMCTHTLHALCRLVIIWKTHSSRYYGDTPCEVFHTEIARLIGTTVKRVGLSDKNDLFLDFGVCRMVFLTEPDGEESWRFFTESPVERISLVASNTWIDY